MMISYKYPIFPNKITQWKLAENLDACRWLYNRLLKDLNDAKEKGIKLKTYNTQNMIPYLKLENPKLNLVYSKVLQMVNYTLWSNFKGLATAKMNGRKIGHEAIGLDVGLNSFVVDSVGNEIENPRCAEQSEDKLAGLQRKLARAVKGSKNYGVIEGKIAKLHKRINCQRDDFLHKLSRMYVNSFDIICVEDLDVKGLKEKGHNNGMHRSIHDASWSKFIFMLSYKAQSAGRKLIKIDPRNTTQRCSACGGIVKKDLSVRVHDCPYCGFLCDRDYNASRNILITGMEQPVAPIKSKPLHHISVRQVLAMKWEAAPFRMRWFTKAINRLK